MEKPSSSSTEKKNRWRKIIPIFIPVLVLTMLMTAQYIISRSPQFQSSQWYSAFLSLAILDLNIILILVLLVVIFRNLVKLFNERKAKILGSRFRTKLVLTMIGITIVPTVLVYITAADLISKGIDSWYAQPLDSMVDYARKISDDYLDDYESLALKQAQRISDYISRENLLREDTKWFLREQFLEPLMEEISFAVVDVYLGDDRLVTTIVDPDSPILPYLDDLDARHIRWATNLRRDSTRQHRNFLDENEVGNLVRCVVPIYDRTDTSNGSEAVGAVVLGFTVKPHLAMFAKSLDGNYRAYREQVDQKEVIKPASQTLLLVFMLMSLFSAIWIGIYISKGITVPIQSLAEATREIASGNLDFKVDAYSNDELGTLVESFNDMTVELKQSKEALEKANTDLLSTNLELERRRRYTETLLSNLSSAVISLDNDGNVSTVNTSAMTLLELSGKDLSKDGWKEFFAREDLEPLSQLVERFFESEINFISEEIGLRFEHQLLHLSATITSIRHDDGSLRGTLIVLDDLTQLVRAQRTAAWKEVAQRIAHEIKNPLTPIQLSAERIRRKLGGINGDNGSDGDNYDLINSCAETILEESGTLKSMVDAFSSFARMPPVNLVRADINSVIEKAVSIYKIDEEGNGFRIDKHLEGNLPAIDLDPELLKMAFVNIINNAVDAMEGRGALEVRSRFDKSKKAILINFSDDGPGIPAETKDKLFLPYFSTKKKGTGLGLAIVSRIVSDHYGSITVSDNHPRGADFTVSIPVT